MANTQQVAQFATSFMRGFSFIDDINNRNRAQLKLDARLEEERKDRKFRRGRLEQIDRERTEEIARVKTVRERNLEGRRLSLLGDDATDDQLIEFADVPEAFAALSARRGRQVALDSLKLLRETRQRQGLNAAVTDAATDTTIPPVTGNQADASLLEPSRGRRIGQPTLTGPGPGGGLQEVSADVVSEFDPDAPDFFSFRNIGENIEGASQRHLGALAGVGQAVFGGIPFGIGDVISGESTPSLVAETGISAGPEAAGTIALPSEFTSPKEFEQLDAGSPEFTAAERTNQILISELKERGISETRAGREVSRLEALKQGSRGERKDAAQEEFLVIQRYEGFEKATEKNPMRDLVSADPYAGVIQYSEDRATLQSADPDRARFMDMQMQPAFIRAEEEMFDTLRTNVAGTPEFRVAARDLRGLRVTQSQIYADYSPSRQAGIDDRGMVIGNAELVDRVNKAQEDPDRPRPSVPLPGNEVKMALTITSRMGNTRRATDAQLMAGIKLVDMRLASAQDLNTLNMTGHWPSSAPAAKFLQFDKGPVYVQGADGNLKLAFFNPGAPKDRTISSNPVTQAHIAQFRAGAENILPPGQGDNDAILGMVESFFIQNTNSIQNTYDLTDPVVANRIGNRYASSVILAKKAEPWWPTWFPFVSPGPTFDEILKSDTLAAELSIEFDIPMVAEPTQRVEGVAVNEMRQELQIEGKYSEELEAAANNLNDELFMRFLRRFDLAKAEAEIRRARGQ